VLRTRLATAAVAIPLLIWLIFASPAWAFAGIIVGITAVGLGEFAAMAIPTDRGFRVLAIAAGLGFAAAVVSRDPIHLGLVLMLSLVGGLLYALSDADMAGAVNRLAHSLVAALYVGFLLPHVIVLRNAVPGGERWVFLAIGCSMAGDSASYFAGSYLGRRKLFPRVSPNKTVEGAIGGLLGSLLFGAVLRAALPPPGVGWGAILAISLVIGVLAQAGDLVESMLKRAYGAKDSGWVIPGHGGVLDRIDALVLPFVFTYYFNAG
jgi:phosphatidate cytidylyltransferase